MGTNEIRKPAVAGQFYPASEKEIKRLIERLIEKQSLPKNQEAIGCVLPHAGYVYSGQVAALTLASVNIKNKIIILGPNHTGYGTNFSIVSKGCWQTPMGEVKIAEELAKKILSSCKFLTEDSLAHQYEHSIEVELPILQYFKKDFEIVPIAILSNETSLLKELGVAIADSIKELGLKNSAMIIASSDMTHYEPQSSAEKKDKIAIQSILDLDEDSLMRNIKELGITMCGYAPVIAMLAAAKHLGAKSANLVKYATSGDTTQDKTSVVGYAGITIY